VNTVVDRHIHAAYHKVKCDEHHPASSVFKPHWTDRSRRYTLNTDPIGNKVSKFFCQNRTLKWEGPVWPSWPPWRRKKIIVDISVTKIGNKNENPVALSNIAKDQIEMYKNDLHIYTDASKSSARQTAAAFFVPELNVQSAVRLSDN